MSDVKVIIPDDFFSVIEFRQEEHIGIATVNSALRQFKGKEVFPWHLSIFFELKSIDSAGLPSEMEADVIDHLEEILNKEMKGKDILKPNALFLARIDWNGTTEFIWRLHDPQHPYDYLKGLLDNKSYKRPFDFRIDEDINWELAEWHLKDHDK
jgi:hypothetical protein